MVQLSALLKSFSDRVYYDDLVDSLRADLTILSDYVAANPDKLLSEILLADVNPRFLIDLYQIIDESFTGAQREQLIKAMFKLEGEQGEQDYWLLTKIPADIIRFLCEVYPPLLDGLVQRMHLIFEDGEGYIDMRTYINTETLNVLLELHPDAERLLFESQAVIADYSGSIVGLLTLDFIKYFPYLVKWIGMYPKLLSHPDISGEQRKELTRGLLEAEEVLLYEAQREQNDEALPSLMLNVALEETALKNRRLRR